MSSAAVVVEALRFKKITARDKGAGGNMVVIQHFARLAILLIRAYNNVYNLNFTAMDHA